MHDEHDLIYSPLQRAFSENGHTVAIKIYRLPDTGWTLEVVDEQNNSTVWDGEFSTDQEALDLALSELREDGIEAFVGKGSQDALH